MIVQPMAFGLSVKTKISTTVYWYSRIFPKKNPLLESTSARLGLSRKEIVSRANSKDTDLLGAFDTIFLNNNAKHV